MFFQRDRVPFSVKTLRETQICFSDFSWNHWISLPFRETPTFWSSFWTSKIGAKTIKCLAPLDPHCNKKFCFEKSAISLSLYSDHSISVNFWYRDNFFQTSAIVEEVEVLLNKAGGELDLAKYSHILFNCVDYGREDIAEYLIMRGCNPHIWRKVVLISHIL